MEETRQKIIDATMILIREKGYVATTTKDIATYAGVNECTLFRRFEGKKDIVLKGMEQEKWRANVTKELFLKVTWDLQTDLSMFMTNYMERVTADFVNLSIGLRAPQIYEEVAPMIMKIPQTFLDSMVQYLNEMEAKGKVCPNDFEWLAMNIFSATFGYTFLKASFQNKLTRVEQEEYIKRNAAFYAAAIAKQE